MKLPIVFGTSSVWRKQVMDTTGLPYTVQVADIDEKAITAGFGDRSKADPALLTTAIAQAKAVEIQKKLTHPCLLITADQVGFYEGVIREKPDTEEECRFYIKSYEKAPACFCSSVVVTNTKTGKQVSGSDIAKQYFAPVPDHVVTELIAEGGIMSTCGAVRIDAPEMQPYLLKREGSYDSVLGLPVELMMRLLAEAEAED